MSVGPSALAAFRGFSEDQWVLWLNGFLKKESVTPALPVFEDRHAEELIALFRKLNDVGASDRFRIALARVFETTPPERSFAASLYIELHALAVATSAYGRDVLRRRLTEEVLEGLEFASTDLHTFALAINGVYHVDEWLADYISSSAYRKKAELENLRNSPEVSPEEVSTAEDAYRDYVLVGFRLLARKNLPECCAFLDRVVPLIQSQEEMEMFGDELIAIVIDGRWRRLFGLLMEASEEPAGLNGEKGGLLVRVVREYVIPSLFETASLGLDAFYFLIEFLVNLDPVRLTADQLYTVLSTVDGLKSEDDREFATRGLSLAYVLTAGGWNFSSHSVDAPAARSIPNEPNTVALFVEATQTWKKLHKIHDEGVLNVLARSMPLWAVTSHRLTSRRAEGEAGRWLRN
ncbi:MAG TPA: hypothetical protein VMF91_02345 [Bryobacteraceae bacterium]|nr:hypothetical protein [Bryobacteraceae bacterium]